MRHRRRLLTLTTTALAASVGLIGLSQADDLAAHRTLDRAALSGIAAAVKTEHAATAKLARRNQSLRRDLRIATERVQRLTHQRSAAWVAAQKAAVAGVKPAAYAEAYRKAFPIALSAESAWYIVQTRGRSSGSTSWTIDERHEFVVASGEVTTYDRGEAPGPYVVPEPDVPDYDSDVASDGFDPAYDGCPSGSYENVDGNCIPGPSSDPSLPVPGGPTAICSDGTYSYSQNRSGTCSHHGGVSSWLP